MTNTTRLLAASLLPFLSSLSLTACSEPATSGGVGGALNTGGGAPPGTVTGGGTTPMGTAGMGVGVSTSGGASPGGGSPSTGGNVATPSGGMGNPGGGMGNPGGGMGNPGGGSGGMGNPGGAGGTMTGGGTGAGGAPAEPTVLTVQLDQVRQIIRGFGVNATITNGDNLPWNMLFTLEGADALGLSILRIGMAEGTESSPGGHRGVPSGWETVKSLGARVIGSCWSAPAGWKTNNSTTGGGHLESTYYADWATRIANYANDNGLYAMSIANEADFASCSPSQNRPCNPPLTDEYESMVYTGAEMAAFVKVAGPIFDQIAPDVKMIAPEASLWQHVWSNISPDGTILDGGGYLSTDPLNCDCYANEITEAAAATCASHCVNGADTLASGGYDYGHWLWSDQEAWGAFDIMGVHQYETQVGYLWPADVNGGVRDKEVWQTEMSGVSHWPESGPSTGIENGIAVARWIHSALTVGEASAWLYWWYKSYYNNNNEGLGLMLSNGINDPPATKRYYTMGNFSRYIRPDVFHAVRVGGPSPDDIMVSAYLGDGGEVVIVAINETGAAADVPIAISGGTAPATMTPYVTSADANWAEGTPVAVADGSLPASLPAMSVTTFVSN